MIKNKIKVCYILPKFDLTTDTHYFYLYDFIRRAAEELDIFLIIENSISDIKYFENLSQVCVQKTHRQPWRFLENLFLVIKARSRGYKNFYIHYSYVGAINASLVSRLTGAQTFYWSCGMMWLFGKQRILNLVLHLVNFLVTGVEALAEGYSQHYHLAKDKIKIMPNWVDLSRWQNIDQQVIKKYQLDPSKKYLLFVHRLAERKGAHYLPELAKRLAIYPELSLLVAGSGPYEKELLKQIKDLGLHNIRLLGKVSNIDIPSLMQASWALVMPSEEEGFPRVLIEAMTSRLPYLAFDIGGVKEISPKSEQSFIVELGNIDALVKAAGKLRQDKNLYQQIQAESSQWVEQYDIKIVVKKFINLFL